MKRIIILISIISSSLCAMADIRLPHLVGDHMVLQRNIRIRIWGWAAPAEKVTVNFLKQTVSTQASADGKWQVYLSPLKAGGPYEMLMSGTNQIRIKDILVGDVWLCGGQSNMEFKMGRVKDIYAADIASSADYPIRTFAVKETYGFERPTDAIGTWKPADPQSVLSFTAVGYFFAKKLYERYHVPIGLLYSAWSGTPVESWISEDSLKMFPHFQEAIRRFKDTVATRDLLEREKSLAVEWQANAKQNDEGFKNPQKPWSGNEIDLSGWQKIKVPGYWDNQSAGQLNGVVWYKKIINIPSSMMNKDLSLDLGLIDDIDTTYFNGIKIGATGNRYDRRQYTIPAKLIKPGANIITVRITNLEEQGGIVEGKTYRLSDGLTFVNLAGEWLYKVGFRSQELPVQSFTKPYYQPAILYQTMIAPITPYAIKGAIWYQGEANAKPGRAFQYRRLLPVMINEWRNAWGIGDFPFLIVQLANYMKPPVQPEESFKAVIRESQSKVAASVPACGLAVTIDIGETYDIHPSDKKDVGYRLTSEARRVAYGDRDVSVMQPVYQSMQVNKSRIVLFFRNTAQGFRKPSSELKQFAISGADRKFVWAKAKIINGNKIVVWSPGIAKPVAVRYAWADNPKGCNLYSKNGFPVSPFRTDHWPTE